MIRLKASAPEREASYPRLKFLHRLVQLLSLFPELRSGLVILVIQGALQTPVEVLPPGSTAAYCCPTTRKGGRDAKRWVELRPWAEVAPAQAV